MPAARYSIRSRIEQLLGVDPEGKPRIYAGLHEAARIGSLNYWLELIFAAGIATLGLVLNSPAVVIGAMLVSPLMGPIIATGLALAAADVYLGLKCLVNLACSIAAAVLFSATLVWLLPFQAPTTEILNRTQPNLLDLGVALLSGLAGSIVLCRGGGGGGVTALPGVAIAVALMPPLCTVGFGVGSGFNRVIVKGAGLLFLTNLAAIVAAALFVFLIVRMDDPKLRAQIDAAVLDRKSYRALAKVLGRSTMLPFGMGHVGLRLLMPVAALAALFLPLRQSLMQLRDEAIARGAIREAIRRFVPQDAVVSEQIRLAQDHIRIRLVLSESVKPESLREAERAIMKRTGKDVNVTARKVAGEEELAVLRERLATPVVAPAPPPPPDLATLRADLIARLEKPLKLAWPGESAPLLSYEIGFSPAGTIVRIGYESDAPIDKPAEEILMRVLRSELEDEALRLEFEHVRPAPPPKPARKSNTRGRPS